MTVTITVEKTVVTVIVKLEELLVKGDGTGGEVITFDVINWGVDKGDRDGGEREGEGDFEEKNDDNGNVVDGERYGEDWEGDGEGDGQLLSGSIKFNEVIKLLLVVTKQYLVYW